MKMTFSQQRFYTKPRSEGECLKLGTGLLFRDYNGLILLHVVIG